MSESPHPLHPDPEIAASLEFDPVPRKNERVDGWTAEMQRAFIAALVATGSPLRAARELGMRAAGIENLRKSAGAESFSAAWDRAMQIHAAQRTGRLCETLERLQRISSPQPSPRGEGGAAQAAEGEVEHFPPLRVVCDKCAAEGTAGDEAFADIPYLLAFEPVPRPAHDRLWEAPTQRAFVAALAVTGSVERAARSIKRHGFAVEKLRKSRGAREFNEACEAALDVARQRELANLNLSSPSGEGQGWGTDEGYDPEHMDEIRERLVQKLQKLRKRLVREEIMPDPEKRAAWILINGPEEIEAIEAELHESAERKATDSAADTSTSARDEHRSHAGAHGEKRNGPDRTAGRLASSEPNPSGVEDDRRSPEGEFTSPKQPSASTSPPQRRGPRIYNLNDPRAFEVLCPRDSRPWIPAGSLPREKRPDRGAPVEISGGSEEEAQQAFKEWQKLVERRQKRTGE